MHLDYIIVGQGLCGTWLSYYLKQAGTKVLLLDASIEKSASSIASGIINPKSGMRLARQWMGDTLEPFARKAYKEIGTAIDFEVAKGIAIHQYFSTKEEADFFEQKADSEHEAFLSFRDRSPESKHFNFHFGIGKIAPALLVNVPELLGRWRSQLSKGNELLEETIDWKECVFSKEEVVYKDISAKAIIDCSGAASMNNSYFSRLPFSLNKGEAILAEIPGLPRDIVMKQGKISIVPWRENQFWIGSTFDLKFENDKPSESYFTQTEKALKAWLRVPFTLQEQVAAIRPATITRAPFSGMHPNENRLGILNGMGSKGCSLAPFLAQNLAAHLTRGEPILAAADISKYAKLLGAKPN
ncbi:MAG: FAD-dependent oxidoreductase [Chitinophagaceae bacterium]